MSALLLLTSFKELLRLISTAPAHRPRRLRSPWRDSGAKRRSAQRPPEMQPDSAPSAECRFSESMRWTYTTAAAAAQIALSSTGAGCLPMQPQRGSEGAANSKG